MTSVDALCCFPLLLFAIVALIIVEESSTISLGIVAGLLIISIFRFSRSDRRTYLFVCLVNGIVFLHSFSRYNSSISVYFDVSNLASTGINQDAQPFVSVVLIKQANSSNAEISQTLLSLTSNSSPVLVSEIVVPDGTTTSLTSEIPITNHLSPTSAYIFYVTASTKVSPGWMNGFLRELFSDDLRLAVPVVRIAGHNAFSSAMISSSRGYLRPLFYSERENEVPIIPGFSVIGMSRKLFSHIPNIVYLISTGRIVELSLRAWFCFNGIVSTRFTQVEVGNQYIPEWRTHEGEDVDERIHACNHNIDWFYTKFARFDDDAVSDVFFIRSSEDSGLCLSVSGSAKAILLKECRSHEIRQHFMFHDESRAIRSAQFPSLCFDSGFPPGNASAILLLQCIPSKRSQFFTFISQRIMSGSFCINKSGHRNVNLDLCESSSQEMNVSQMWQRIPVNFTVSR